MSTQALAVSGLSGVAAFSAGDIHNCAVGEDNVLKCWGSNTFSQCAAEGDSFNAPVAVSF